MTSKAPKEYLKAASIKIMHFSKLIFPGLILILLTAGASYSQDKTEPVVEEYLARQVKENKAKEYKEVRTILRGDLNGDGKEDIAVFYVLYELKSWPGEQRYLAVFINDGENFQCRDSIVAGKTQMVYDVQPIKAGKILVETKEYFQVGHTFITMVGQIIFTFVDGKIKRIDTF